MKTALQADFCANQPFKTTKGLFHWATSFGKSAFRKQHITCVFVRKRKMYFVNTKSADDKFSNPTPNPLNMMAFHFHYAIQHSQGVLDRFFKKEAHNLCFFQKAQKCVFMNPKSTYDNFSEPIPHETFNTTKGLYCTSEPFITT